MRFSQSESDAPSQTNGKGKPEVRGELFLGRQERPELCKM
ncbi:unnamed protein product [Cuscuta europaea]|uniref:Uncharacterized protein n=1 Tax=Cuscuta europaea TaxID=41803 RepID=A0A9P0Z986_CUSEU|nr:unnamed protein product [Cuscuta europaea]